MRLNRFIANCLNIGRRQADVLIKGGQIKINGQVAILGSLVANNDRVEYAGKILSPIKTHTNILLNKPIGYVCSRNGQGSPTVFELLPPEYQTLKIAGRLDKNSSGLLLLTNDGQLIYDLTHPKTQKQKIYEVRLDKPLSQIDFKAITSGGVTLKDGISRLLIELLPENSLKITMHEGRNRQIRRTFEALGYTVTKLHRTQIGPYKLDGLTLKDFRLLTDS